MTRGDILWVLWGWMSREMDNCLVFTLNGFLGFIEVWQYFWNYKQNNGEFYFSFPTVSGSLDFRGFLVFKLKTEKTQKNGKIVLFIATNTCQPVLYSELEKDNFGLVYISNNILFVH